jgi:hypothetical protein
VVLFLEESAVVDGELFEVVVVVVFGHQDDRVRVLVRVKELL